MKQHIYSLSLAFCSLWLSVACFSQHVKVIHVDCPGRLDAELGDDRYEIDSVVVTGTLNFDDLHVLNTCCQEGELSVIDLSQAQLVDNTIPERAFFLARIGVKKGLQKIMLPEGLEKIGDHAFSRSGLCTLRLPSTVRTLGKGVFVGTFITDLVIPEGVEVISKDCFATCNKLEEVRLPSTIRILGSSAFLGSYGLKKINLPEGLTSIGPYCFSGTILQNISLPNTVTEVGKQAFSDNDSLISIKLSNALDSLPELLFWNDGNLARIVLPPNLRTIGDNVFEDCDELKKLYVPSGIPSEVTNPNRPAENPFHEIADRCTLYVPVGAKEKYRSAAYWKEFREIEETPGLPSGVAEESVLGFRVLIEDHTVIVTTGVRKPVVYGVYTLSGVCVKQMRTNTGYAEIVLPTGGMYILKIENEAKKIVL